MQFRAVLEPTYFEFTTQNALVHPKLNPTVAVSVHFDWQKLPADWTLETSFGAGDRCQSYTGLWNRVNEALFAGGIFACVAPPWGINRSSWPFEESGASPMRKLWRKSRKSLGPNATSGTTTIFLFIW
jgi:hypothetical protein